MENNVRKGESALKIIEEVNTIGSWVDDIRARINKMENTNKAAINIY